MVGVRSGVESRKILRVVACREWVGGRRDGHGTVAIVSVWRDRADLDAMLKSGEEPFARRLIREADAEPRAEFFDIRASSTRAVAS